MYFKQWQLWLEVIDVKQQLLLLQQLKRRKEKMSEEMVCTKCIGGNAMLSGPITVVPSCICVCVCVVTFYSIPMA